VSPVFTEIGTGVPFYAGSVPENLTLMEVDRAVAIEQAGDRIKERTASLQHKLDASESARLRAEGRLQQALAALAQSGRRSVMPVPQSTAVKSDVVKIPEPSVVAPPDPEAARVRRGQVRRALVAGTVGTAIEWYDFFLYGTAAALVFPKLFFPGASPYIGALASFAT